MILDTNAVSDFAGTSSKTGRITENDSYEESGHDGI